jgi:hypothetical protein
MEKFKFHRLAKFSLEQLPATEQADVLKKLDALVGVAPGNWPGRFVKRVPDDPSRYLLLVNGTLRAILRAVEGKQPEVLDLFRKEASDRFAKSKP